MKPPSKYRLSKKQIMNANFFLQVHEQEALMTGKEDKIRDDKDRQRAKQQKTKNHMLI